MRIFQKGFNYSQDGSGNRLVYHLQGCNMRCPWCSNPEGMASGGGKEYTIDEIVREAVSCRSMFFDGGGVTFTGGEMSLQLDEVLLCLKKLREVGINSAIETNALSSRLPELFAYLDEVMIDLKHPDNEIHRKTTGVSNIGIKQNIARAVNECERLLIRIPLIHGFNDSPDAQDGFLQFFRAAGVRAAEILPYHEYGREKWNKLGLKYTIENGYVDSQTIEEFEQKLRQNSIDVRHT